MGAGISKKKGSLTPMEQEIMVIIWRLEECSVHDILDELPEERDLAYTTVSSVVRTLEKKQFVRPRKRGRTHLYSPVVSRSRFAADRLRALVAGVFQGKPKDLVRTLVDETDLTHEDLQDLAKMLKKEDEQ